MDFLTNHLWSSVLLGVYIIIQQIQRKLDRNKIVNQRSEDFIALSAKTEADKDNYKKEQSNGEIERYAISKFKSLKKKYEKETIIEADLVRIAAGGILLGGFLKAERIFFHRLANNGFHTLNPTELEDYVKFASEEFYDTLTDNVLTNRYKGVYDFSDIITLETIINSIRSIIDTSIGIQTRTNNQG